MIIEFMQDYCGRETAMNERKRGEVDELPFAQASALIRLGIAIEPPAVIEPPIAPKTRKSKRLETASADGGA